MSSEGFCVHLLAQPSGLSKSQEELCVAMCDPLFVGRAHRELIEEFARLRHRTKGIVGREHDSVGTYLKEQVKECWREVETTNCVVEVLS